MVMTEKEIRRIDALGISNSEKADVIRRRQADMLERLKSNAWFRHLRGRLQLCDEERCGNNKCVEVCAFADWRRRQQLIPAAYRLFKNAAGPIFEVKVVRGEWQRRAGDLLDVNIPAIKQMNKRALDSMEIANLPGLIAVGTFKALIGKSFEPHWVCQIHQIVAGTDRSGLTRAFRIKRSRGKPGSTTLVEEVKDLAQTISSVLRADVQGWYHPVPPDDHPLTPTEAQREEFYRWLLSLSYGGRIIRYGCDRYLNPLNKKPQVTRPKVRKQRSNPVWLTKL
jgi:hypothetical protein